MRNFYRITTVWECPYVSKSVWPAFLLLLLSLLPSCSEAVPPPNIIVILADDMGAGDIGAYNPASKVPTPNLDQLAAAGLLFTDAHSPSAVCTPTRYGLLTGRYAWRTRLKKGVLWGYSPALIEAERLTIADRLQQAGYKTAAIGKWHLGLGGGEKTDYARPLRPGPVTSGFDYFFGIPASLDMDPYLYVENDQAVEAPTETIGASEHRRKNGGGFWREGAIAPGFRHVDVLPTLTRRAIDYIKKAASDGEGTPYFLYLALTAPHTPWLPTEEFRGKSAAGYYGDFCAQVDSSIGSVLDALERSGESDHTLLIFTSDNGAHWPVEDIEKFKHRANLSFRGQKADIWEGGHRVPFIVRWPGKVAPGSRTDETICLTDIYATLTAVVKESLSDTEAEDSFNLLPLLLGRELSEPIREATVHHSLDGMFSIRQGQWKLILGRGSGGFTKPARIDPAEGEPAGQLYDLEKDPGEQVNLYQEHPEVVKRLTTLLERYQSEGRSRPKKFFPREGS